MDKYDIKLSKMEGEMLKMKKIWTVGMFALVITPHLYAQDAANKASKAVANAIKSSNADPAKMAENLEAQARGMVDSKLSQSISDFISVENGATEISITGITKEDPQISALILRPIGKGLGGDGITFIQSSIYYFDKRTTLNLGVGQRYLLNDGRFMFGYNGFYDYEVEYGHSRTSVGAEFKTSVGELVANRYFSGSDWKTVKSGNEERALGGYDVELGVPFPYMPTTFLRVKDFQWYAYGGTEDFKGTTYSVSSRINNQLSLEFGTTKSNNKADQSFVQLSYSLNSGYNTKKSKPFFSANPYSISVMEGGLYEKVRRENRIIKQVRSTGFAIEFVGI
jgi:adhesin/invasin